MYNVLLHGTAGPEPDIAKVRIYLAGTLSTELAVAPNAGFDATLTSPGNETLQIGYSFVDTSGNESAHTIQTVTVPAPPDIDAPSSPSGPMQVVSVVWVP